MINHLPPPPSATILGCGFELLNSSHLPDDRTSRYAVYWFLLFLLPILPLKLYIIPSTGAAGIRGTVSQRFYLRKHGILSYIRLLAVSMIRFYGELILIVLLITGGFLCVAVFLMMR